MLATRKGHLNIVKKLLDNGADPNKMTGVSAFVVCCYFLWCLLLFFTE